MRKKEKAYSIALTLVFIIFLVFVSSTASASNDNVLSDESSTEGNNIASYTIDETRITTSGSAASPAIYRDLIVWVDHRNGNSDIYMYNVSTKKEIQITTNGSAGSPAIYGNRIVWEDSRNSSFNPPTEIYMYDLFTSKESRISPSDYYSYGYLEFPKINGDKIVWQVWDGADSSYIYMYDLSTSTQTQINTGGGALSPAIYGDRIVWEDRRNGNDNIYMYNVSTEKETQITDSEQALNPAIYGNKIVWYEYRNGNCDIYMYNLSTKKETRITSSPDAQTSPDIYGNRIVWKDDGGEDDGGEYHGIYMCDLSTNQKMKITSGGSESDPAIYDNRIVWEDNRNGEYNHDIYMGTLITSSPIAAFSASPTSGKAPLNVTFTDKSTRTPTSWKWTFGDGTNSTEQNPTHRYRAAGNYTVKLTAINALGNNTTTKTNYIKVIINTRPGPYSSK